MQIGIDVGATKIEYILLHENGEETNRSRIDCPKDYSSIIKSIKDIVNKLEKTLNKELPVGVCHPGIHSIQTGLIKNSPNCNWIENKPFQKDLRKAIGKEIFCENSTRNEFARWPLTPSAFDLTVGFLYFVKKAFIFSICSGLL